LSESNILHLFQVKPDLNDIGVALELMSM